MKHIVLGLVLLLAACCVYIIADDPPGKGGTQGAGSNRAAPPPAATTMHRRWQQQLRDPQWAPSAERAIQRYFSLHNRDASERFEIHAIECRRSICEIQAASASPGGTARDAEIWQRVVSAMLEEPWWTQLRFKQPATQLTHSADERRLLLVTYLIRQDAE